MNLPASLLLMFALLIGLPLAVRLYSLGRGRGCIGLLITLIAAAIPLAFLAGSFYLDTGAPITSGTVTAKQEPINVDIDTGSWTHNFVVDVRVQPDNASYPETIATNVSPALYDAMHIGQVVPVHYIRLANLFLFTRLAQQSTLTVIPWNIVQVIVVLIGAVLIVWLWRKSRRYGLLALLAWLVLLALLVTLPMLTPRGEERSATAQVEKVNHFTQIEISSRSSTNDTFDTVQPFDIVQVNFTPQGYSEPITAVDAVDSGSVKSLEVGGRVTVLYPVDNPRMARIDGAGYTHYWKNPLGVVGVVAGALLLLALLWIMLRVGFRLLGRWLLHRATGRRSQR